MLTAFLYPALVTVVAFVIVIFLMTYVVPQVVDVFRETRQALPWPTRLLLFISEFLRAAWPWLSSAAPPRSYGLRAWLKLPGRRHAWDAMLLELPIAGRITRATNSARFASTLSILVGAGVPLLTALEAARATLANSVLSNAVGRIIEGVREGASLSARSRARRCSRRCWCTSRRAANRPASCPRCSSAPRATSRARPSAARSRSPTLVEPLLILAMGAVVLGIVLAVLMPIIEINQLVR